MLQIRDDFKQNDNNGRSHRVVVDDPHTTNAT